MDIQEIVAGIGASGALQQVATQIGVPPDQASAMLHGVLDHVAQNAPLEGMTDAVANRAGVAPAQVQQFLPAVLGLLQNHQANATAGVQGLLGTLVSAFQGPAMGGLVSMLDTNHNGSVADEALGLASNFLNRPRT